jgi:hypothetical protein
MRRQRRNKHYSAFREQLRREDAADVAKLTPAQRLHAALDLSDFCLTLAGAGAERSSAGILAPSSGGDMLESLM